MSKIEFFSLGGMDENDKNCFVLEVDDEMFIFNMGISIPTDSLSGIKKIIPDIEWISRNVNKVKGIFIGFPSKNNIGSFQYIYNHIKNVPIYSSGVGVEIISSYFNKRNMKKIDENFELNLIPIDPLKTHRIGKISFTPFRVTSSIPCSLGFIFHTNDGDIVYLDDFIIYNDKSNAFINDFFILKDLLKKEVLLLISSVGNVAKFNGFTNPNHKTKNFYLEMLNKTDNSRLIVSCYDYDIYSFLTLMSIAKEKQIPFIIYNPIFVNVFNFMANKGFVNTNSLPLLPIQKINEVKKGIVLVLAPFDKLFEKLSTIATGQDEILKLKKNDVFVLGIRTVSGFEKQESEILDKLSIVDVDSYKLPKNFLEIKPSIEDHKYLVNYLKPKYIIPTSGMYYETIKYAIALKEVGFNPNDIITLYNGEILNIVDGKKVPGHLKHIELNDCFIGSQGILSEGSNILIERKVMAENGIIFFSLLFDKNKHMSLDSYDWKEIGVFANDEVDYEKKLTLKNEAFKFSQSFFESKDANLDLKMIKQSIKKFIAKQVEKFCSKTPIIIVSII